MKLQATNCIVCHRIYLLHTTTNFVVCATSWSGKTSCLFHTTLLLRNIKGVQLVAHNNILTTHALGDLLPATVHCLVYLHLNVMNNVTNNNKTEWTQERRCWRRLCWRQPNIIIMGYQSIHPHDQTCCPGQRCLC